MFGITKDTQDPSTSGPIPVGINENVKFNGATFTPLKEGGEPTLQYHFEDSEGRELRTAIWKPTKERSAETIANAKNSGNPRVHKRTNKALGFVKGEQITSDEMYTIDVQDFNAYNKHILNRFVNEETIVNAMTNVSSYEDFANAVVKLCDNADLTPLVRLKVVYSYDYKYHELPKNHYNPFISLMTDANNLTITEWDRVSRPGVVDDAPESFNVDALTTDDDLAF